MPRTYTPGYAGAKAALLLVALAILALGSADLAKPLRLVFGGKRAVAEVVRVTKTRPGVADEVYSTTRKIEQDPNRAVKFWHYVEFADTSDHTVVARLNVASTKSPVYQVGESVTVAYDPAKPEEIVAVWDLRTWAFGGFIAGIGLIFAVVFGFFLYYARKPIELAEEAPPADQPAKP